MPELALLTFITDWLEFGDNWLVTEAQPAMTSIMDNIKKIIPKFFFTIFPPWKQFKISKNLFYRAAGGTNGTGPE
jgi:hypothetical protein